MKFRAAFLSFSLLFLFFQNGEASRWEIKVSGGLGFINGGDLNRSIGGWRDYYMDHDTSPYSFNHDVKELKNLLEGRAECIFNISSHFNLGVGFEFLTRSVRGEMSWSFSQKGNVSIEENSLQQLLYKFQAIPVTLSLYYTLSIGEGFVLSLGAGGSYYFGRFSYEEDYQYIFDYSESVSGTGNQSGFVDQYSSSGIYSIRNRSSAIGFHGSGSFEVRITKRIFFMIEVLGRIVNFTGWKSQGSNEYSWEHTWGYWGAHLDEGTVEETIEGRLWFVEFMEEGGTKEYPRLVFSKEKPASPSYHNVREGKINMNGFSLRIGFRLRI